MVLISQPKSRSTTGISIWKRVEWVSWFDTIPVYEVDTRVSYSEIVVPTDDSIRMKYLMRTLMSNDKHVLMPGPTGTGKSVYVQ